MKKIIYVVISPSYGKFEPNRSFEKVLRESGFSSWEDIEARTHEKIISFIENHAKKSRNLFDVSFLGKEKNQYIALKEVDIDRPWTISIEDGSESISYLDYDLVQPELNFYQMKK
jgi:hypothetical protein